MTAAEIPLPQLLSNPSRPVFLLGEVPPREGTPPGKCQTICSKFMSRSKALACDGFIVYDIQDEPSDEKRPFPYRKVMDSSPYAALLSRTSGKQCLVYKCVTVVKFDKWIDRARNEHGHNAINLVGRPRKYSSQTNYPYDYDNLNGGGGGGGDHHPSTTSLSSAMNTTHAKKMSFGCVCIPERHTLETAQKRGKAYPTEHQNMIRKQQAGAQWFICQAVYDAEPTIRLLKDYAALCRQQGIAPRKIVLTFCPVSQIKTLQFIKWLGVRVPQAAEDVILNAERPVEASVQLCCDILTTILQQTMGIGVPLGISCESVSIYKAEIDGVHDLFRKLQGILLDARGTPWKVQWVEIMPPANCESGACNELEEDETRQATSAGRAADALIPGLIGVALGGALVAVGVAIGGGRIAKMK